MHTQFIVRKLLKTSDYIILSRDQANVSCELTSNCSHTFLERAMYYRILTSSASKSYHTWSPYHPDLSLPLVSLVERFCHSDGMHQVIGLVFVCTEWLLSGVSSSLLFSAPVKYRSQDLPIDGSFFICLLFSLPTPHIRM